MKTKKVIIGSSILLALGVATYFIIRSSTEDVGTSSKPGTPELGPGSLVKVKDKDKIYYIDNAGFRHWITTRAKFDSLGYKMSDVKYISSAELNTYPSGTDLAGLGSGQSFF